MAVPAADTMRQSGVTGLALGPGPVETRCQLECSGTKNTVAAARTTHAISQRCAVVRNRAARSLVILRKIQPRPAASLSPARPVSSVFVAEAKSHRENRVR